MQDFTHYFNLLVGTGAIITQIISVVALGFLVFGSKDNAFLSFIKRHFLLLGFLLSLSAFVVSFTYSDLIGFVPCALCWWQRIYMFPQLFLFGVAYWKKDNRVIEYVFPLLVLGTLVALYHNFIYYFGEGTGPCDASGVSCVQKLVSEFGGYISIPMLSLTGFVALLVLLAVARFHKRER